MTLPENPMKRRYIYSILVGAPGLVVALIVSVVIFGVAAGFLWLFVFGDNAWPAFVETALPILFVSVFLLTWLAMLAAGYFIGKAREQDAALNKMHVAISAGLTILLVATVLFYEWGVGNLASR
jgi:uncharacterized membrane protein